MLGFLSLLVTGGILAHESIKFGNFDAQSKADAKRAGETEYFNHRGECRDVNNDHKIFTYYNPSKGYTTRTDLKTGEVRNITLERLWADPNVKYIKQGDDKHFNDRCAGVRFLEKSTGKLMVKRDFEHMGEWWMGLDGTLIRPTESSMKISPDKDWEYVRNYLEGMRDFYGGHYCNNRAVYN